MPDQLVFLCGARDFHAMDWYRSSKAVLPEKDIYILTDLIEGQGFKRLITEKDIIFKLIIIDRFLFNTQSRFGDAWRNLIKLLVFPVQVVLIKRFSRKHPNAVYHAHSMYYLFLAWASGISYVGTPQGSDILIKPFTSKIYKYFTIKSLKKAKAITVDSEKMKETILELTGREACIVQNGIDLESINIFLSQNRNPLADRDTLLSIRGFAPLYRIKEIVSARNGSLKSSNIPLTFIYPFYDNGYMEEVRSICKSTDLDLGRVDRIKMYELLLGTNLVISIPYSDSSPRSVYEAIFCGCAVAIDHHAYYDVLPECMKSRIILVDLADKNWFDTALEKATGVIAMPYLPSNEALNIFDQKKSFKLIEKLLFH